MLWRSSILMACASTVLVVLLASFSPLSFGQRARPPEPRPIHDSNLIPHSQSHDSQEVRIQDAIRDTHALTLGAQRELNSGTLSLFKYRAEKLFKEERRTHDHRPLFFVSVSPLGSVYVAVDGKVNSHYVLTRQFFVLDFPSPGWSATDTIKKELGASLDQETDRRLTSHIIFDEALLLDSFSAPAEFERSEELTFASKDPPPEAYQAKHFGSGDKSKKWFARMQGCCLYTGIPPGEATLKRLKETPFHKKEIHVINLFDNSGVTEGFKRIASKIGMYSISAPKDLGGDGLARLKRIFVQAKGQSIVIVGHVEGSKSDTFVTTDSENRELFRFKISELEVIADQTDVNLLLLGCSTEAALSDGSGARVSTLTPIDALRVVEQFTASLGSASNWAELLTNLSAPDLPLVASSGLLKRPFIPFGKGVEGEVEIYRAVEEDREKMPWRIGTIWFRFRCALFRIC